MISVHLVPGGSGEVVAPAVEAVLASAQALSVPAVQVVSLRSDGPTLPVEDRFVELNGFSTSLLF